ncbi:MAG: carbon storage regulator [Roseburia sp.]|nr:carbon storage regulator [Roseburia sp.]
MLRLTVRTEEYLMINDNIKIIFLGGTKNNTCIMIDAPRDVDIVRSTVLENKIVNPEERAKLPRYYRENKAGEFAKRNKEADGSGKNRNSGKSSVIITRGNQERQKRQ